MRLKHPTIPGKPPEFENITWSDHRESCQKCRSVDADKSASFVNACALGSALLSELLVKRQAPVQKQKEAEVREWAKKAGVFKL